MKSQVPGPWAVRGEWQECVLFLDMPWHCQETLLRSGVVSRRGAPDQAAGICNVLSVAARREMQPLEQ